MGAENGFCDFYSSWLPLSQVDRQVLLKAPHFLAADRWGQANTTNMGFESIVAGYIATNTNADMDRRQLLNAVQKHIDGLPILKDDKWPFLPKEIFSISIPAEDINPVPITYRSVIIHFGMSVKELESELEEWLTKFEIFLKAMPGVWESLVNIKLIPYTGQYKNNHLSYRWYKEYYPKSQDTYWIYEGDQRTWNEIVMKKEKK